jgi:hypothetical protein
MVDAEKDELDEQEEDSGDGEEEDGVAEVGDADGRLGRRSALGVGKEEGLVFGTDGRTEDGHGDGGFF